MSAPQEATTQVVDDVAEDGDYQQEDEGGVTEGAGGEGVKENQISQQELSDLSKDNIIEGERSTRGDPLASDKAVDQAVDAAVDQDRKRCLVIP
ncbi:BQ2448_3382 [Microbotryum intermedium]|uniref:BQ2448_3382 protein n=1 Tax=Microbotryum intermedium TaxID=269621 RepID=A0A238F9V1_9BASI|nr:BQ2448_3382 [Microbotryum intermedium]